MTEGLEPALALLFRRFRERKATENELVKLMSLTLGWAKPSHAPNVLARGVQAGLIRLQGDHYVAVFDPNAVDLPFGFRPPPALFAPPGGAPAAAALPQQAAAAAAAGDVPPLEDLIDAIASRLGCDRKAAVGRVNAKQQALEGAVTLDVAALLVAGSLGIEVRTHAQRVLDGMRVAPGPGL